MGIKDFYKYFKNEFPECFIPVSYDTFNYQKIAIDMMNLLYVYGSGAQPNSWMTGIIRFLISLRKLFIHPVCVFDGKTHPLKLDTVQKRKDIRNRGKERIENIQNKLEHYKATNEILPELEIWIQDTTKRNPEMGFRSTLSGNLLVEKIENVLEKQSRNYNLHFTTEEVELLKKIIQHMGITVITAPYDGEALCSRLNTTGQVAAVISNDSDVFFFGCDRVITKFNEKGGYSLKLDDVLQKLELSFEEFTDLCFICGTDFNGNIKGIGFIKGLQLIRKYKSIHHPEFPYKEWIDEQNIIKIRKEILNDGLSSTFSSVKWSSRPSDELSSILFTQNIPISIEEFDYGCSNIELSNQ